MKKKFNITGACYPEIHYTMDNSAKLAATLRMVEEGEYYIINRPGSTAKRPCCLPSTMPCRWV